MNAALAAQASPSTSEPSRPVSSAACFAPIWRRSWRWAVLFGAASTIRTALDWLAPPSDFQTRSTISTAVGVGLLLIVSFHASLRSGSLRDGLLSAVATAGLGGLIGAAGAAVLLAAWHDPATMEAIARSGGLWEVLTFPVLLLIPAVVVGTLGGLAGTAAARWRRGA